MTINKATFFFRPKAAITFIINDQSRNIGAVTSVSECATTE